ncbi:MAG: NAD-glutamate dehydrogenase [Gammaproteobacteria bacterium]|nr:NAD-glutamate dehydrogenase [Gammaproteobacteria bacterium]
MATSTAANINEFIDPVVSIVADKLKGDERAAVEEFVRQYYSGTSAEDLVESEVMDLYGAALAHWNFARQRKPGEPKIRIYNPQVEEHGWQSTHTIVEIVTDDMPFLVDSVRMALNRRGLTVHFLIHPVMRLRRDDNGRAIAPVALHDEHADAITEAVMHIEVDRQTEKEVIDETVAGIQSVLSDVRSVVADWKPMRKKLAAILDELDKSPPPLDKDEIKEARAILEWLDDNHFTYLGYREYELSTRNGEDVLATVPGSGLGVLRNRKSGAESKSFSSLPPEVRRLAREPRLLIITKGNSRSTVHRPGYLDYIGVKRFNDKGVPIGERRFIGLYTSAAYNRSPRSIPLLSDKVQRIIAKAGYPENSHDGKALMNILENFPRDELFQISEEQVFQTAMGILHLQERQRIRLFVHRDRYGRFFTCLVFVPRERFNTQIRLAIQSILEETFNADGVEFNVQLSDSVLAHLHFVLHVSPGAKPEFDIKEIESRLRQVTRSWSDDLYDELLEHFGEERGTRLRRRYGDAFRADYRENYDARVAVRDVEKMEGLSGDEDLAMSLYRPLEAPENVVRFKLFHPGTPISLSDALPMLENMGLRIVDERPSKIKRADGARIWMHDFGMHHKEGPGFDFDQVRDYFQDAFACIWRGEVENDGFNHLVLRAKLTWREIVILRAYCKYLRQAGVAFSQSYMERTLSSNPKIASKLVKLFHVCFDPGYDGARDKEAARLVVESHEDLDAVVNLDEDRILRSFLGLIQATLRTNFYQKSEEGEYKDYVSFKFDPSRIQELPEPRPMFEIFVYSPRVEGVHLRGGPVARGGLRWSDRREDFRTEVLGLVKAQMVKNAVIVPVGSKGGFVPKRLPSGDREAIQAEGVACYKTFIRGLLDITDNLVSDQVQPPKDVVRLDGDDPYLVVAADKGTATFSDIANGIAKEYGFWLGDAFASGGSQGYDHKGMGITARGGWESVKRHFRELGVNIQTTDFEVIGIGDMGGDVFGNGMLLSEHIRLIGAFNHLHIFLDPNPEAAKSFKERKRLFEKLRSTWEDYDKNLISKGGGIYSRAAKSIKVSEEVREALGIEAKSLTPNELIRAMLKAPVDLLWNGGIGTYVKSSEQHNDEVGDRANDAVRIDATELRCKVVGEGGNLGFTQLGRIEYSSNGGRLFTDAIDNSAGVDCSDHEVNIKILLNKVVEDGDITEKQRNTLLEGMTDEVGDLVLRNNYLQTQALSLANAQSALLLEVHARLVRRMERDGELDREIEYLPGNEEIQERMKAGMGLTNPELSVLIAYVKIGLFQDLLASSLPGDAYLVAELEDYFPEPLQKRYKERMPAHRLAAEIISTVVANEVVNRSGITYVFRLGEETGAEADNVARAYLVAREIFGMKKVWDAIEALDNKVPAQSQILMLLEGRKLLERASRWLLRKRRSGFNIASTCKHFSNGIEQLADSLPKLVMSQARKAMEKQTKKLTNVDVPQALAEQVATFNELYSALDIVEVSKAVGVGVDQVAAVYFTLGAKLDLLWMRDQIVALPRENRWQALARAALRDDLYDQEANLTADVFRVQSKSKEAEARITAWMQANAPAVNRCRQILSDLRAVGTPDFAMLSVAMREIRSLRPIEEAGAADTAKEPPKAEGKTPKGKSASAKARDAETAAGD